MASTCTRRLLLPRGKSFDIERVVEGCLSWSVKCALLKYQNSTRPIPLGWDQLQLHCLSHTQPAHRGRESRRPQIGFILPRQRRRRRLTRRTDR